ncbi:hypothetical protein JTB14_032933 [Gonioctena quinquepunctata]|nr:hypothetical protein JTB14_032933 [Gonioctena quinquepunctata]
MSNRIENRETHSPRWTRKAPRQRHQGGIHQRLHNTHMTTTSTTRRSTTCTGEDASDYTTLRRHTTSVLNRMSTYTDPREVCSERARKLAGRLQERNSCEERAQRHDEGRVCGWTAAVD